MTVRIRLATDRNIISDIIRWYTWSQWSHVDLIAPDGKLIGARYKNGVQARPADYGHFTRTLTLEAPKAPDSIYDWAYQQIGKPYSTRTILGLAFRQDFSDDNEFDCSEFAIMGSIQCGYPFLRTTHAGRITPRDLALSPLFNVVQDQT